MPSHDFYLWCGIGIIVSILLIATFKFITPLKEWADNIHFQSLFWFETTSLLFFGASWLKKGQLSSN
jgi:FtsH-binding integral membrane protein